MAKRSPSPPTVSKSAPPGKRASLRSSVSGAATSELPAGPRPAGLGASFVVDCSVSVAWLFDEQGDAYTEAALDTLAWQHALAPSWWPVETLSVLLMLERRGRLTAAEAVDALRQSQRLPVRTQLTASSPFELHALASRYRLTSYETLYLDLALSTGTPLATRDKALAQAAEDCGVGVWRPDVPTSLPSS
jgi:predicted nucleic acid-binding protein